MTLEEQLGEELLKGYYEVGYQTDYWGNRFISEFRQHGALRTAKNMLRPTKGNKPSPGLQELIDAKRTDLALERVILRDEFRSLFTPEELAEARRRLEALPPNSHPKFLPPEDVHPETLPDSGEYAEGAVKQVLVNVYERSAKARAACIRHHGCRCKVCGFDFAAIYGERGKDFIHVHHNKPIAMRRKAYKVNPKTDLDPVCPNCHAMLHRSTGVISVEELKRIIDGQRKAVGRKRAGDSRPPRRESR